MKTYDFTIELTGVPGPTPESIDRLYEAGCDDATISWSGCTLKLQFSREAESLQDAIFSAQSQAWSVVKSGSTRIIADYDQ